MTLPQLVAAAVFSVVFHGANAPAQQSGTDARFEQIYKADWAWRRHEGTGGSDEEGGRGRGISPNLPKVDVATQQGKLQHEEEVLRQLDTIDANRLSPANQVNYAVYRPQVVGLINQQRFKDYEKPLNSDSGFWNAVTGANRRPFRSETDYQNYVLMLRDVPRYFAEEKDNMRAGLKRGFTPPQVTLIGRDASIASIAQAKTPEDCSLYFPFKSMPGTIAVEEQKKIQADGLAAVRDSALPAFQTLLKFMRSEYIPGARKELAAWSMPDGKAYYQAKILEFTKPGFVGSMLTNPAMLAGAAGIMAQLAMQQTMEEITEYLAVIDEKVDDILRAQKDAAIAEMIGVGMVIDDAMLKREHVVSRNILLISIQNEFAELIKR